MYFVYTEKPRSFTGVQGVYLDPTEDPEKEICELVEIHKDAIYFEAELVPPSDQNDLLEKVHTVLSDQCNGYHNLATSPTDRRCADCRDAAKRILDKFDIDYNEVKFSPPEETAELLETANKLNQIPPGTFTKDI